MEVFIRLLFAAHLFNDVQAFAFTVNHQTRFERTLSRSTPEANAVDDYDVTCYVVNEDEIIADGEEPHVVCTGEPEEVGCGSFYFITLLLVHLIDSIQHIVFFDVQQYAWFNGIESKMMIETDGVAEEAMICEEGESYKGKPEWECKK